MILSSIASDQYPSVKKKPTLAAASDKEKESSDSRRAQYQYSRNSRNSYLSKSNRSKSSSFNKDCHNKDNDCNRHYRSDSEGYDRSKSYDKYRDYNRDCNRDDSRDRNRDNNCIRDHQRPRDRQPDRECKDRRDYYGRDKVHFVGDGASQGSHLPSPFPSSSSFISDGEVACFILDKDAICHKCHPQFDDSIEKKFHQR